MGWCENQRDEEVTWKVLSQVRVSLFRSLSELILVQAYLAERVCTLGSPFQVQVELPSLKRIMLETAICLFGSNGLEQEGLEFSGKEVSIWQD